MLTCSLCGAKLKAGLRPRTLIQKAVGLVFLSDANRDETRSGDIYPGICPDCQEEREVNP